jgi:hypothetical protein
MVEVKQMSTKDKLERKKYMGVCSFVSEIVAKMMSRLPSTVSMYVDKKSPKSMGCNL